MRSLTFLLAAAIATAALGTPMSAQPATEAERPGRYTMQPTEGGFLRLDTTTGDVTLCQRSAATFECRPVKDDRDLQPEIARLASENKALKAEVKRLEDLLAVDRQRPEAPKFEMPSEQDVDKALNYVERMLKKFRDKLKDLESPSPAPGGDGVPGRKGTPL
jgi:hypothetical protein